MAGYTHGGRKRSAWIQRIHLERSDRARRRAASHRQKIQDDANVVLRSPEVKDALQKQGAQAGGGTSEELGKFVDSEIAKWAKVIKDSNITVN